jgi:type II secretory pathway component PulJ
MTTISALTLLEMLVSTTLLVIIVLGLTAMFIQTQKAFKGGFTQTDVSESGRTVVDMMARDLQQMSDAKDANIQNFFYGIRAGSWVPQNDGTTSWTNYLTDMFALERINTTWFGVGYAVSNAISGGISASQPIVGTLYRYVYQTNDLPTDNPVNFFTNQANSTVNPFPPTNFNRIIDGVIHLRFRAFDVNGSEITNAALPGVLQLPADSLSTPLPNSIELELGILDPQIVEQLRALGTNTQAQMNFLTNRIGAVHVFRQQIPVRAALPR